MKITRKKIEQMIAQLDAICSEAEALEKRYAFQLSQTHRAFRNSAANMLHYLALRHHDISELQRRLGWLGVSRLGRAESHVLASAQTVRNILKRFAKHKKLDPEKAIVTLKQGVKLIKSNTTALLGKKLKGSKVRIMVTLPTEAASDKKMVRKLVEVGMNCARINCAHDNPETWKRMIDHIKAARRKTGRNCKIAMDLGGPKLRTGEIAPGPQVLRLRPKRDALGRAIAPAVVYLGPEDASPPAGVQNFIPVAGDWLGHLKSGDEVRFRDTRKKRRTLELVGKESKFAVAHCNDTSYLVTGTDLTQYREGKSTGAKTKVSELPAQEGIIRLRKGDLLILHKNSQLGEPAEYDAEGNLIRPAHLSCTLPEIFEDVRAGEPILLDDGKIEGVIRSVSEDQMEVEITYAKGNNAKLAADKGINLPKSNLRLSGLTEKDRQDLEFVAKHADIVNMSFVNSRQDVLDLLQELERLKADRLGIILKIETRRGYQNLPAILLTAMQRHPIGIMIARGDLAIEGGWDQLAQMQEEILWLCEAAHVPIVWATQVLETLAKKGRPSRAEISDAAMAQRAECVMLNKGPHITDTIQMLDGILKSMEEYHQKKADLIPALKSSDMLNYV